ncbi:MAG: NADH-quinone oxidoreductase subunit C [Thermodesulfobacteriota bacterium]
MLRDKARAALAAITPEGVQETDYKAKGYHVDAAVAVDQVLAAVKAVDGLGFFLEDVCGVDWLAAGEMEVVYHFAHVQETCRVVIRTRAPRDNPEVPSISGIYPGANWHERETHDFFGIRFAGHPYLVPLLLPEDADFHPLRKDFKGLNG